MPSSEEKSCSLSEQDKFLLEEYQVCNNKANSYTMALWQIGAIFITASILLLIQSTQLFITEHFKLIFPLAIVSIVILILWVILYNRFRWYNQLAFLRATAIEEYFANHSKQSLDLKIDKINTEPINSWINHMEAISAPLKVRKPILAVIFSLIIIWVVLVGICLMRLS